MIVGLATGPFRVQLATWPLVVRTRLELAERWVERAERTSKKSLTTTLPSPYSRPLL